MADDEDREVKLEWLREPPAAGQVRVTVECGEGVELSAESRQALEDLMIELAEAETLGYMTGNALGSIGMGPNLNIFTVRVEGLACKACKKT